jgi:hypothetical protein
VLPASRAHVTVAGLRVWGAGVRRISSVLICKWCGIPFRPANCSKRQRFCGLTCFGLNKSQEAMDRKSAQGGR